MAIIDYSYKLYCEQSYVIPSTLLWTNTSKEYSYKHNWGPCYRICYCYIFYWGPGTLKMIPTNFTEDHHRSFLQDLLRAILCYSYRLYLGPGPQKNIPINVMKDCHKQFLQTLLWTIKIITTSFEGHHWYILNTLIRISID